MTFTDLLSTMYLFMLNLLDLFRILTNTKENISMGEALISLSKIFTFYLITDVLEKKNKHKLRVTQDMDCK